MYIQTHANVQVRRSNSLTAANYLQKVPPKIGLGPKTRWSSDRRTRPYDIGRRNHRNAVTVLLCESFARPDQLAKLGHEGRRLNQKLVNDVRRCLQG